MTAYPLRRALDREADHLTRQMHYFCEALEERYPHIRATVEAQYRAAGQPYGPGLEAAWQWYAERALAHHLMGQVRRIETQHANLSDAQRLVRPEAA